MLKVFTSFTGVGSQEMALRNIGVDFEVVGISEVDRYALNSYSAIHCNYDSKDIIYPENKVMIDEFKNKSIGYNFSTNKSEIPRSEKDIKQLYKSHILSKNYGDIRLIDEKTLPDFDLFTYSFPCKDISVAGASKGFKKDSNTQSSLLWECERIINHKKPKYLLMENVKNLVGVNNIKDFNDWINILNMIGYVSYYSVLNAKDFNIPQNRERVIMVSIRKDLKQFFSFPEKEKLNLFLYDLLDKEVETKYYINTKDSNISIDKKKISYCIDANYWKGTNVENYINKKRRQLIQAGYIGKSNRETNRIYSKNGVSPTLTSMNGGNRQPKIISVERTPLRFLNRNQKNISGDYSFCIDTPNTGGVKEELDDGSYRIRKLTPIECWRLMGYTDEDFYKAKNIGRLSDTKLYERAGNGIVVTMLEKIFYNLLISDKFKIDIEIGNSFFEL